VNASTRRGIGRLLDVDLRHLRRQLEASRDYIFATAGIEQDLFRDT
jgi:5-methylthioadenosine/S-adenosylhomocysteine deaminase